MEKIRSRPRHDLVNRAGVVAALALVAGPGGVAHRPRRVPDRRRTDARVSCARRLQYYD